MNTNHSGQAKWSGSFGFIMAAAGSAIGLGNLWRFPMLVGENGGGAFVVMYLLCILFIGIPMIIAEVSIGRAGGKDAFGSYRALNPKWGGVGILAVITSFIGLAYYSVLGGWVLRYILASVGGITDAQGFFDQFTGSSANQIIYYLIFMGITVAIVIFGVQKGIERSCKIMMPLLFVFLVIVVIRSCTLPGAAEGLRFYLKPDFSKLSPNALLLALGQVFFSLSLGTGGTITYGAYLGKDENIPKSALFVALCDTAVALLAGFAILPAVFALGFEPSMGPSLMFVTLPAVFADMPGGVLFSVIFFILVLFAAVSTSIAYLEVVVSFCVNSLHLGRTKASVLSGGLITLLGIPCGLSFGVLGDFKIGGKGLFDLCDYLVSNVSLPIGAILACIFIGYVWKTRNAVKEITNGGALPFSLAGVWSVLVKYILPAVILLIFVTSI